MKFKKKKKFKMANKLKKKKVSAVVHELLLHQNFGKIFHKSGSYALLLLRNDVKVYAEQVVAYR